MREVLVEISAAFTNCGLMEGKFDMVRGTATMQNKNRLKFYSLFIFFRTKKNPFQISVDSRNVFFPKKIRQKQLLKPFPFASAAEIKNRVENCF